MSRFGIRTIPATVMVAVCVSAAFCTAAVHAQTAGADNSAIYLYKGADRDQRLIAKAREEGTLTFYTSMATTESGPLALAFCGSSDKETIAKIKGLEKKFGPTEWIHPYLASRGLRLADYTYTATTTSP